ncbi:MAG: hypothetical protein LVQ95_05710 [Candidatus Micrarchaeales archaeon]|nr:hypothetical protein [Candidatus Micrarchaeales archaeon]
MDDAVSVHQILPMSSEERFGLLGINDGIAERSVYRTLQKIGSLDGTGGAAKLSRKFYSRLVLSVVRLERDASLVILPLPEHIELHSRIIEKYI